MASRSTRIAALAVAVTLGATAAYAVDGGDGGNSGSTAVATPASGMAKARQLVNSGKYNAAIRELKSVVAKDGGNADAWNLLGFSSRKLKQYDAAAVYYANALKIDPRHLGALEYQGELFIETGQRAKAQANLRTLTGICGSCEEAEDLRDALVRAGMS